MPCPIQNPVFVIYRFFILNESKIGVNFRMLPVIVYRRKYITVVNQFYKTSSRMPVSCDAINVLFIIHDKKRLMFTVITLGGFMSTQDLFDIPFDSAFNPKYKIHYQGSKARLFLAMGDLSTAKKLYQQNLEISKTTTLDAKGEIVRTYCYYGNVRRLLQEYDAAEDAFLTGMALSQEDPDLFDVSESEIWVRWQYAKVLYDMQRHYEIDDLIEDIPQ